MTNRSGDLGVLLAAWGWEVRRVQVSWRVEGRRPENSSFQTLSKSPVDWLSIMQFTITTSLVSNQNENPDLILYTMTLICLQH